MSPHDSTPACPLAALLAEALVLIERRSAADVAMRDAVEAWRVGAARRAVEEISATLEHLAARACDHRPTSREGALFAIVLAAAEAEALATCDDTQSERVHRRLRRHLYALRAFLETGDTRVPAPVSAYWMRAETDPHAALAG